MNDALAFSRASFVAQDCLASLLYGPLQLGFLICSGDDLSG
jgi:hypothetical protein